MQEQQYRREGNGIKNCPHLLTPHETKRESFLKGDLLRHGHAQHGICPYRLRPVERVRSVKGLKEVIVGPSSRGTLRRHLNRGGLRSARLDLPVLLVATHAGEARLVGTDALDKFIGYIPSTVSVLGEVEVTRRILETLVHHTGLDGTPHQSANVRKKEREVKAKGSVAHIFTPTLGISKRISTLNAALLITIPELFCFTTKDVCWDWRLV